jgi:hypothetical protein
MECPQWTRPQARQKLRQYISWTYKVYQTKGDFAMINLKKISLIKYALPTGLAVMSNQFVIGLAKFAKVGSVGVLELVVPIGVFVGYFWVLGRIKKGVKKKPEYEQLPPPNYDEYYKNLNANQPQQPNYGEQSGWNHDREFITRECGVKEETFENGVKRTVYEFERRSNTW